MSVEQPQGTWMIQPNATVSLQTEKIGGLTSLHVTAPVKGGRLHVVSDDVALRIELSLAKLKASNFLMQGAARALIKRYDGDLLVFDAAGESVDMPWTVSGQAQAGTVDIPMTVLATPRPDADPTHLDIGGTVTMDDLEIPIPGLREVNSITFSLEGTVTLRPA